MFFNMMFRTFSKFSYFRHRLNILFGEKAPAAKNRLHFKHDFHDVLEMIILLMCFFMNGNGKYGTWKSFLEAIRFILTKYEPVSTHGDPVGAKPYI